MPGSMEFLSSTFTFALLVAELCLAVRANVYKDVLYKQLLYMQAGAPYLANVALGEPSTAALPLGAASSGPDDMNPQMTSQSSLHEDAVNPAPGSSEQLTDDTETEQHQSAGAVRQSTMLKCLRQRAQQRLLQARRVMGTLFLHLRRHGHMAAGLLNLGYEAAFLLKCTPFFSPALHCSGLTLVRDDGSSTVRAPLQKLLACLVLFETALEDSVVPS